MDLLAIKHSTNSLWQEIQAIAELSPASEIHLKEEVILKYKLQLLAKLKNVFEHCETEDAIVSELTKILEENWDLVRNNLCSYTSLPKDDLTLLLCDIAEFLAQKSSGKKPIVFLMPTIYTTSLSANYKDLDELSLKEVLCTHITSHDSHYLIPAKMLVIPAHREHPNHNPYYSYEQGGSVEFTSEELHRLTQHSPETKELSDIQVELAMLEHDGFLERLGKLQKELHFNSKHVAGKEEDAGKDVYLNLRLFREYWDSLSDEIRTAIPKDVIEQIQLLLALASPAGSKEENEKRSMDDVDLCVAQQSESLRIILLVHHDELARIRPDNTDRIAALQEKRDAVKKILRDKFEAKTVSYEGQDSLYITADLLRTLGMKLHIASFEQLQEFIESTCAEDLQGLRELEGVKSEFSKNIHNIGELVTLLIQERDEEKLSILLSLIKDKFLDKDIIQSLIEFGQILNFLTTGQIKVVCESLQEFLSTMISDSYDFGRILYSLNSDQITTVCQVMHDRLTEIVRYAFNFEEVFNYLAPDQITAVCQVMHDRLSVIVGVASDFKELLLGLTIAQCTAVCQAMHDRLFKIVRNTRDFKEFLRGLDSTQCTAIYQIMHDRLPAMIRDPYDFERVLAYLPPKQRLAVYQTVHDRLPAMIKDISDFRAVLGYLLPAQSVEVYQAVRDQLPAMIKCAHDFGRVLEYLPLEQRLAVYLVMHEQLPAMIESAYDFGSVLEYLPSEQCLAVYQVMYDRLPALITSILRFNLVLQYLPLEQRSAVYKAICDRLPALIKDIKDFSIVHEYLISEQRSALCHAMCDRLPALIKDIRDFRIVLYYLTPEQCTALCQAMRDRLPALIRDGSGFEAMLESLSLEQRSAVYKVIRDQLPALIKDSIDFKAVLHYLIPEQRSAVYQAICDLLPALIENVDDFVAVFEYLPPEQRSAVYRVMCVRLPALIRNVSDFITVLKYLPPEQRSIVYQVMRARLPALIREADDFSLMLDNLTSEQCSAVYQIMCAQLPKIIIYYQNFRDILAHLTPAQRSIAFVAMKYKIAYIIANLTKQSAGWAESWMTSLGIVYEWKMLLKDYNFQDSLPKHHIKFLEAIASLEDQGLSAALPTDNYIRGHQLDCIELASIRKLVENYNKRGKGICRHTAALFQTHHRAFFATAGRTEPIYQLECYLQACEENDKHYITAEELSRLQVWAQFKLDPLSESETNKCLREICELQSSRRSYESEDGLVPS